MFAFPFGEVGNASSAEFKEQATESLSTLSDNTNCLVVVVVLAGGKVSWTASVFGRAAPSPAPRGLGVDRDGLRSEYDRKSQ